MPRSLDLDRLKRFEPAPKHPEPVAEPARTAEPGDTELTRSELTRAELNRAAEPARTPELPARWPSREPVQDGQISIKAPLDVISRFKRICKDDRRTYADMLHILMDRFGDRT